MANLRSIGADIREVGVIATAVYMMAKVLRTLGIGDAVYYLVFAVDLAALGQSSQDQRRSAKTLEPISKDDQAVFQPDTAHAILQSRFAAGAMCHGLFAADDRPLAWIWHQDGRYREDEVEAVFVLPGACVWDFGIFVLPEHRAGRTLSTLWQLFAQKMQAQGVQWSFSRIAAHNRASLRAHMRLPHKTVGKCVFIRLGRFQFSLSSLNPRGHVCRLGTVPPTFHLDV